MFSSDKRLFGLFLLIGALLLYVHQQAVDDYQDKINEQQDTIYYLAQDNQLLTEQINQAQAISYADYYRQPAVIDYEDFKPVDVNSSVISALPP